MTPNPDVNDTPLFDIEYPHKQYKIETLLVTILIGGYTHRYSTM